MSQSQQTLLYVPGSTEGSTQWKAETLQMANWGGFHGYRDVTFVPDATLLTGPSGAGKSTLLDAYIALMMPSDTPFNGASNDATTGRVRGADQRNLLTYLRGKIDSNSEATGEVRDQNLRGTDSPTWGAVAMTFADDNGRRFTALRAYFAPRNAVSAKDVTMRMATLDGYLDLRELAEVSAEKFDKRAMKMRFPDMKVFDAYNAFADNLYARLGIGANGDGSKAMRLLARIQSGHQVKTVDGLYKAMVLETPKTYEKADKALQHFADLERAYEAMVTAANQVQVLERIPTLYSDYEKATNRADLVDAVGVHRLGDSPFLLWRLRTERDLLTAAADDNRASRRHNAALAKAAKEAERDLHGQILDVQRQRRENGGDALERLREDIEGLGDRRDEAVGARAVFDQRISPLHLAVPDKDTFDEVRTTAEAFRTDYDAAEADLGAEHAALVKRMVPLEQERGALEEEAKSLAGREGLVPVHLHRARMTIAEATGIPAEDLPFVAELIDIAPGQEQWRRAAEVTLGSLARVLLVDQDRLDEFSRAIDPVHLGARINFEGARLHMPAGGDADPRRISGKLVHKDSPFTGWLQQRLRDGNDALCVDSTADLAGGGLRVTVSGQTRHGRRGAHGWNREQRPIIGFSNRARLEEIAADIADLTAQFDALQTQAKQIVEKGGRLRARKEAYQFVLDTKWVDIDVDAVDAAITAKQAERDRLLAHNDILHALEEREDDLKGKHEREQKARHLAEDAITALDTAYENLDDRLATNGDDVDRIERDRAAVLSLEHAEYLTTEFAAVSEAGDLEGFTAGIRRLQQRLLDQIKEDRDNALRAQDSLTRTFHTYLDRWPNPDLGTTLAYYPQFNEILTDILTTGLHNRRQEWKRRLSEWSGQDLVPLHGAFDSAIDDIEDRLLPVNEILTELPFGANKNRLRINLRRLNQADMAKFRKELRALSSGSTVDLTDEQIEARFKRLRAFMGLIRKPQPGSRTNYRDYFLDVRKHVEITAVCQTVDGVQVATYSALGGKSGGETQELIAFIVGAALRYQLGDEDRARPRFAPVFLDEGFIKSDSQFAGRAVTAWKRLGFQLIVGAPLDKVTALEPYMGRALEITKDTHTGYSFITPFVSTEPVA